MRSPDPRRSHWIHTPVAVAQKIGVFGAPGAGACITLTGLWSSPVRGASMNPARSFGADPSIADFSRYRVHVVGPITGALIAVGFAWVLRGPGEGRAGGAAAGGHAPHDARRGLGRTTAAAPRVSAVRR